MIINFSRWKKEKKGFTITELILVVVIISIMAGFGIPNYTKAVERAHVRDVNNQLLALYSANQVYRAQNGRFWPADNNAGAGYDVAAISTNLGLSIIPNGMTYNCTGAGVAPGTFSCTSARNGGSAVFTLTVTQAALSFPLGGASNPSYVCTSGTCPQ